MLTHLIKGRQYAISFSGGSDSLFAAHKCRHYNPTLYHFNHRLNERDDEIEEGARLAAQLLGLNIVVGYAQSEYQSGSVEDYCRKERYRWLSTVGGTMVVAHNLRDAVEGYLLNCLKGCPEYLPIPISTQFGETSIVRPFILTPKGEIDSYLYRNGLESLVVDDWLNLDLARQRVWIRLSLLPQIAERTNLEKVVRKQYLKRLQKSS